MIVLPFSLIMKFEDPSKHSSAPSKASIIDRYLHGITREYIVRFTTQASHPHLRTPPPSSSFQNTSCAVSPSPRRRLEPRGEDLVPGRRLGRAVLDERVAHHLLEVDDACLAVGCEGGWGASVGLVVGGGMKRRDGGDDAQWSAPVLYVPDSRFRCAFVCAGGTLRCQRQKFRKD